MAKVVVIGAGICGLATALLLARDGHEVLVLDKDDSPTPESVEDCWGDWQRKGIAQFRQPHNFMPAMRLLLEAELPDLQDALIDAGAVRFDMLKPMPNWMRDSPAQPVDEQLWTYTCRRPTGEWVFLKAAEAEKRIRIRRGVAVEGLVAGPEAHAGTPHVSGVRTSGGERIDTDLVVDASGRGTRSRQWLEAIGADVPEAEDADCSFTYYTRYFSGTQPDRIAPPLAELQSISILSLPGDRGSWSLTIFTSSNDRQLKGLRDPGAWMRTVAAHPLHAHWLDGEAISDVLVMGGPLDRYRRLARDDEPVVTGFVAVADAWACTNPSAGRGMTIGVMHALRLRDVLRASGDDPWQIAADFHEATERDLRPWYESQIASDKARFAQIEAHRTGRPAPAPADALSQDLQLLRLAMLADGDLYRLGIEYVATLATVQEILARPGVRERMQSAVEAVVKDSPPPIPGPSRQQLVELAAAG